MEAFEKLWQCTLPSDSKADPSPVTSLLIRDETIVAGFVTGHIRIYRANIGELAVEVAAHTRPVMGLALHPRDSSFASCSEDQHVSVWVLPDFESRSSSVVDCFSTRKLPNRMLTGAAFVPQDRLALAAYDDSEIAILRKE
jgi:WD40 repeat protein